jgi:cobalt-precorrin 5A hydrolase
VPRRHGFALAMGAFGYERLATLLTDIWPKHDGLICIMAAGIVVRQIAPLLRHKATDPAIVVVDELGHFAISLLSGHLGGANRLASEVARLTGAQTVITTASDVQGRPALDLLARDLGLEVENPDLLARIARALLEEETLWICDPEGRLQAPLEGQENLFPLSENGDLDFPGIWVSERTAPQGLQCLVLRPRNLVVGIGCNRGTKVEEILALLRSVFEHEGLSTLSIRNLASIDLKSDEPGLLEAADFLDRPLELFTGAEIKTVIVPNPSSMVEKHVGVLSVCEATALLSAQSQMLIVPKHKTSNATLAVARVGFPS